MAVAQTPSPASNRTRAGFRAAADNLTGTDIIVAVGDEAGGTADDQFTLNSHGLVTGDYLYLLYKSAAGTVTGAVGTQFRAAVVSANIFTLETAAGAAVVNTADGTAVFLKGSHDSSGFVQTVVLPNLIVATGDFTGQGSEDVFIPEPETGYHGLEDTNQLVLLYKAAAGVLTGISAGTTVYAKSVDGVKFELAASSGGADIENTADGLAVFVKAS